MEITFKKITVDTNLFVLNMEDNGDLRTLVKFFKNCNTPAPGILDSKVVLVAMFIESE